MREYYLEPVRANQKSFNRLATVQVLENGDKHLISYVTHVATVTADGKAEIYELNSQNTTKHIKDFLIQEGFDIGKTTKDMVKMYMIGWQ